MINLKKILSVLSHQIGDTRRCPYCSREFTLKDLTAKEAEKLFLKLKKKE